MSEEHQPIIVTKKQLPKRLEELARTHMAFLTMSGKLAADIIMDRGTLTLPLICSGQNAHYVPEEQGAGFLYVQRTHKNMYEITYKPPL